MLSAIKHTSSTKTTKTYYTYYLRTSLQSCVRRSLTQGRNHVFKVGRVQFLGLGYCTEQNMDGIPSLVYCSLLRNGNHTLHQKSWGGPYTFWGSGP